MDPRVPLTARTALGQQLRHTDHPMPALCQLCQLNPLGGAHRLEVVRERYLDLLLAQSPFGLRLLGPPQRGRPAPSCSPSPHPCSLPP